MKLRDPFPLQENKSDEQNFVTTSTPTSEGMEEREDANDCSLLLSLSLPEQRTTLASGSGSTSSSSSPRNLNQHDKSDGGGVNIDLSIFRIGS